MLLMFLFFNLFLYIFSANNVLLACLKSIVHSTRNDFLTVGFSQIWHPWRGHSQYDRLYEFKCSCSSFAAIEKVQLWDNFTSEFYNFMYLFLGVCFDYATLIENIRAFLLSYAIFCPLWGEIFYVFIMIASSCFNAIDIKLLQNFRFSQLCHTSI